jgi:hypothetical protein
MAKSIDLDAFKTRLREARDQGESWPLVMAEDVLLLADQWSSIRPNIPNTPKLDKFLLPLVGRGWTHARFRRMHLIVERLGESCRRTWGWQAAQWACNTLSDTELADIQKVYPKHLRENGGRSLSITQIQRVVRKYRRKQLLKRLGPTI